MAGLENPGIVPVYGLGEDSQGRRCYAMRFIEGNTLQKAIHRYHAARKQSESRVPLRRDLEFRALLHRLKSACTTVAYAHSKGVLHRDLKPANIMLGPFDETLVVDWGLAKEMARVDGAKPGMEDKTSAPVKPRLPASRRWEWLAPPAT